jgi:hypothetical protein
MSKPPLRRALASAALVSALTLLPVRGVSAEPRQRPERKGRPVAAQVESFSFWDLLAGLFQKAGSRMDPDGVRLNASVSVTPDGQQDGVAQTDPGK